MRILQSRRASFRSIASVVGPLAISLASLVYSGPVGADTAGGFLTVASIPPAKVIVDDQDSGRTTPVESLPLTVGDHKLTLVSADGTLKRTLGFKITKGQTTRLKIAL